jgi:hypothetical protein
MAARGGGGEGGVTALTTRPLFTNTTYDVFFFAVCKVAALCSVDISYLAALGKSIQTTEGRKYFTSRVACWPALIF